MSRTWRTLLQSIVSPVISTSLYFVVFGAAIGSRMAAVDGVSYGAFIIPGLIMLSLLTQSISQRLVRHLLPQVRRHDLRAAVRPRLVGRDRGIGYVGAAASKSLLLGLIILATARLFVPFGIAGTRSGWPASWC